MSSNTLRRVVINSKYCRFINLFPKRVIFPNEPSRNRISQKNTHNLMSQQFSSQDIEKHDVSRKEFERICEETLESLCERLEVILESHSEIKGCDITLGDGVLTLSLGVNGTYVINRQSPNKQIWLSSPQSGPKRYDFIPRLKTWIYKHDNVPLHCLLQKELTLILKEDIDLSKCSYYVKKT